MIKVFPNSVNENKYPKNSRIFLTNPKTEELQEVAKALNIDYKLLLTSLDENALTRIHFNDITAVYIDIPYSSSRANQNIYKTSTVGIFLIDSYFVMVSYRTFEVTKKIYSNDDLIQLNNKELLLYFLNDITKSYILYLKEFYQQIILLEKQLKKIINNNGIFQLMEYQRSLTYLSTSIRGIKRLLNKVNEKNFFEDDNNLLEDTIVAAEQATEMTEIFVEDVDSLIEAFGSVISNNLNQIMKILTSLTLIIAIPTMVAGIYGMNIANLPFATHPFAFWAIMGATGIISIVTGILFYFKKML